GVAREVVWTLVPDNPRSPETGSIVDYSALPGPGGRRSRMPAVDDRSWTLKVALSQRPWSFVAAAGRAVSFLCNGLTPVSVGRAVDDAIATSSLQRPERSLLLLAAASVPPL